jgi:hypothetical protein
MEFINYVVFSEGTHWNRRFLKTGFGHCYVARKLKKGWIILNPQPKFLHTKFIDSEDFLPGRLHGMYKHTFAIAGCKKENETYCLPIPWNCVTICKYIIGLEKPGIITPHQLYKHLVIESYNDINFKKAVI